MFSVIAVTIEEELLCTLRELIACCLVFGRIIPGSNRRRNLWRRSRSTASCAAVNWGAASRVRRSAAAASASADIAAEPEGIVGDEASDMGLIMTWIG